MIDATASAITAANITQQEFVLFQRLIYKIAGISLSDAKQVLLVGRLSKRLKQYGLSTFAEYYRMLSSGDYAEELQTMVDLLTTNETYFFREPTHFDFLRNEIVAKRNNPATFRVWSAASSSGEEAYSVAFALVDRARESGRSVEIVGSEQAGADPELVGEVHLRHDALGRMVARPKTVGTTLGDAASKLGEATKSELLFMMHADFTVRTTGRKALIGVGVVGCSLLSAGLLGGTNVCSDPDAGDYSAYASLVDGDTGEILWTTVAASGPGDLRREKATRKLAKALTKKLPNLKPAVDP